MASGVHLLRLGAEADSEASQEVQRVTATRKVTLLQQTQTGWSGGRRTGQSDAPKKRRGAKEMGLPIVAVKCARVRITSYEIICSSANSTGENLIIPRIGQYIQCCGHRDYVADIP